ncbi:MAG: hypothetical protein LBF27_01250 [Sphingobacterium sp.]|jgi:uncharacterized protein (DUF2225 family)|nr:hypothetical protein [Sphingobacterium sp.]
MNEIDDSKRNSKYLDFMRSEFLEETEIIQRTLFLRSLFDFSMYNRATEEDWDVLLDRNLDLKNRITKLGKSTKKIDDMLNNWSDRKYHWISVCKKWKEVKEKHLSNNLLDLYIISCKWDFD